MPKGWMSSEKEPANTISDESWHGFMRRRSKALGDMPEETYEKHKTTYKQVEAAKKGRN